MVDAGRIAVRIAEDGLTAAVEVRAGNAAGQAELALALSAAGVSRGIDAVLCARLSDALADPNFECSEPRTAVGQAPIAGEAGSFEAAFQSGLQAGVLRDDGTMDFHDRGLLVSVAEGALVGHLRPATPGQSGFSVDGKDLSATAGRPLVLQFGPGIAVDADGAVRATRAGVVLHKPGKSLDVVIQHVHAADVDLHSGHLHMEGSLVVKGSVAHSFQVHASGDVEIAGSVDGGSVYSGGSVRVGLGVRGGDGATVTATGNLSAHHAEAAMLHAGGTMKLEEAVHSVLTAERIAITRRMRGGSAVAEHSIVVGEAGMPQGTQTTLCVGEPLEHPVQGEQPTIGAAKNLRTAARHSGMPSHRGAERTKGGKLDRSGDAHQREEVANKLARVARREALLHGAFIEVKQAAHPGVVIRIGDDSLLLTRDERAVRFSYDRATRRIRTEKT